jgi:2-polyprenyl-6-methoxyphenol hydroxylase-like FAD-dependent oxidoreductase
VNRDQHVLIVGAGIGGLCLAQGLRRAGISHSVYERAPDLAWGGYILHMTADGGDALRRCLPGNLYQLYVATSRRSPRRDLVVLVDHLGKEVGTVPHLGPANDPVTPHTSVHRRTLCQILLAGITDVVHFGRIVTGYRYAGDDVVLEFADGGSARGTMVVGADGIQSIIRRQLLPEVEVIPLVEHALLTQAPLTNELAAALLPSFEDSFIMVRDALGTHLATGLFQPRNNVVEAAVRTAPGVILDPVDDYVAVNLELTSPELGKTDFFSASKTFLHSLMRAAVVDWHPALRHLIDCVSPPSITPRTIRMLSPAAVWPTGRVTLLGDAIHAMPPMYGHGANSALYDAAELVAALTADMPLRESVAQYEANMRARTFPLLERSIAPAGSL